MNVDRRSFLKSTLPGVVCLPRFLFAADSPSTKLKKPKNVVGEIGLTTGSFMRHLSVKAAKGKLRLLDLPQIMRDELDMRVIDLMTRTLASFKPDYIDDLRDRAEKAGCIITNLKMNQRGLDMASPDAATRKKALDEYKRTIDVAARLGCRWVRPSPTAKKPDLKRLAVAYRELIDYSAPKGITLLVENAGWILNDPDGIPEVIKEVGKGLDASPDTGNWTDAARYEGLQKAFPFAVTCDYKAYMLGPKDEHPRYDLKCCFEIAWKAGFRGPWCIEHFNDTLPGLLRGFGRVRDMLKRWTVA